MNSTLKTLLLFLLILFWMLVSWYGYVCGVKGFCIQDPYMINHSTIEKDRKIQQQLSQARTEIPEETTEIIEVSEISENTDEITPVQHKEDRTIIYFEFNSGDPITNESIIQYLLEIARHAREHGESIDLVGHTDAVGNSDINQQLGYDRAHIIKNILVEFGMDPTRITTNSQGETKPIASNDTEEGQERNRRVEIFIN